MTSLRVIHIFDAVGGENVFMILIEEELPPGVTIEFCEQRTD